MPTTLVVGASGELGAAVARELSARGHALLVHGYSHGERLDDVATAADAVDRFLADITQPSAVVSMFERIERLDNLVFCAGINPTAGKVSELSVDTWRKIIDVNVTGAFLCLQAALRPLEKGSAPSVVMVSSIFGLDTPARRAPYGASKHALTGLVQAVAKEEGSWLRINAVCPGPMWSENLRSIVDKHAAAAGVSVDDYVLKRVAAIPTGRLMNLDECASVIAFLCSADSSFINGECLRISGGAVE